MNIFKMINQIETLTLKKDLTKSDVQSIKYLNASVLAEVKILTMEKEMLQTQLNFYLAKENQITGKVW